MRLRRPSRWLMYADLRAPPSGLRGGCGATVRLARRRLADDREDRRARHRVVPVPDLARPPCCGRTAISAPVRATSPHRRSACRSSSCSRWWACPHTSWRARARRCARRTTASSSRRRSSPTSRPCRRAPSAGGRSNRTGRICAFCSYELKEPCPGCSRLLHQRVAALPVLLHAAPAPRRGVRPGRVRDGGTGLRRRTRRPIQDSPDPPRRPRVTETVPISARPGRGSSGGRSGR